MTEEVRRDPITAHHPLGIRMRHDEIIGVGDALSDVAGLVTDTVRDMHRAITSRGFARTAGWLGPLVRPVEAVHDALSTATYRSVRAGLSFAITTGARIAATRNRQSHQRPGSDDSAVSPLVGVMNGIIGDRLAEQGNPLAFGFTLRHLGRDLAPTAEALMVAHPDAGGRIAVFVPGLCDTEAAWRHRADEWHAGAPPTHGDRLHRDRGYTPLWVRYNSGRRVSANGAELDALLDTLTQHWPVPVEELVLVGYSMGGLVARSAVHRAVARGAAWPDRVAHVVCLGAPHHGAPLEKLGNATTRALGAFAVTRPLQTLFNHRSVGIKDLRYGNVTEADWLDHPPDALLRDGRVVTAPVAGIPHHGIGAVASGRPWGHVIGDLMVPLPSATGRHRSRPLPLQQLELVGLNHLALRNHPNAYRALLDALDGPAGGA